MGQANDRLVALGQKRCIFRSLKQAQKSVEQAEKRASLPASPIKRDPSPGPSAGTSRADARKSLLTAIAGEKAPGALADLYGKLAASYLAERDSLPQEAGAARGDLTRLFTKASRNSAYCAFADRQINPQAAKAKKALRLVTE